MDKGAWWATVHGVAKSDFYMIFQELNPFLKQAAPGVTYIKCIFSL